MAVSTFQAITGGTQALHFWSSVLQAFLAPRRATVSEDFTLKAVLLGRGTALVFFAATRGVTPNLIGLPLLPLLSLGSILGRVLAGTTKARLYLLGLTTTLVGLPTLTFAAACPLFLSLRRSDRIMAASEGNLCWNWMAWMRKCSRAGGKSSKSTEAKACFSRRITPISEISMPQTSEIEVIQIAFYILGTIFFYKGGLTNE